MVRPYGVGVVGAAAAGAATGASVGREYRAEPTATVPCADHDVRSPTMSNFRTNTLTSAYTADSKIELPDA